MLTCWSDSTRVTSDSSRERSSASTWIATRKTLDAVGAHSTSMRRSACCANSVTALVQSPRCTETPAPRVTNPTISSPGTGVQQRASLTQMSEAPLTTTPGSPMERARRGRTSGVAASETSSVVPSAPPRVVTSRWTTLWAETCPSPTAAYSAAMSG